MGLHPTETSTREIRLNQQSHVQLFQNSFLCTVLPTRVRPSKFNKNSWLCRDYKISVMSSINELNFSKTTNLQIANTVHHSAKNKYALFITLTQSSILSYYEPCFFSQYIYLTWAKTVAKSMAFSIQISSKCNCFLTYLANYRCCFSLKNNTMLWFSIFRVKRKTLAVL